MRVARAAAAAGVRPARILHSDKLRARQTAELLAEQLGPAGGVHALACLEGKPDRFAVVWVLIPELLAP